MIHSKYLFILLINSKTFTPKKSYRKDVLQIQMEWGDISHIHSSKQPADRLINEGCTPSYPSIQFLVFENQQLWVIYFVVPL